MHSTAGKLYLPQVAIPAKGIVLAGAVFVKKVGDHPVVIGSQALFHYKLSSHNLV